MNAWAGNGARDIDRSAAHIRIAQANQPRKPTDCCMICPDTSRAEMGVEPAEICDCGIQGVCCGSELLTQAGGENQDA